MKNQKCIKDADRFRVDLIRSDRRIKHHIQEVCTVAEVTTGINDGFADTLFISHCRHGTDHGDQSGRGNFDLVFLDPPYAGGFLPKVLAKMIEWDLLADGAFIVCESANENDVFGENEELKNQFNVRRVARYGAACVTILEKGESEG